MRDHLSTPVHRNLSSSVQLRHHLTPKHTTGAKSLTRQIGFRIWECNKEMGILSWWDGRNELEGGHSFGYWLRIIFRTEVLVSFFCWPHPCPAYTSGFRVCVRFSFNQPPKPYTGIWISSVQFSKKVLTSSVPRRQGLKYGFGEHHHVALDRYPINGKWNTIRELKRGHLKLTKNKPTRGLSLWPEPSK